MTATRVGDWFFLGGQRTSNLNSAAASLTLPTGTDTVMLIAEGGVVRYTINGTATATSYGYVAEDTGQIIGPFSNLASLSVYGGAGVYANAIYLKNK